MRVITFNISENDVYQTSDRLHIVICFMLIITVLKKSASIFSKRNKQNSVKSIYAIK